MLMTLHWHVKPLRSSGSCHQCQCHVSALQTNSQYTEIKVLVVGRNAADQTSCYLGISSNFLNASCCMQTVCKAVEILSKI